MVRLLKIRCPNKKFLSIIQQSLAENLDATRDVGFGGLLRLACEELRYDLC